MSKQCRSTSDALHTQMPLIQQFLDTKAQLFKTKDIVS